MRLIGKIHITLRGETVTRGPTFLERMKRGLGGKVDLTTDRVKVALEATAVVDQVKRALVRLGIDNAVSLVIDDTVIFQDMDGRAGDLPDLLLALSEHSSVFGRGFRELRLAVEHEEAGLHLLVETRAVTEHKRDEPSAFVSVGGRLKELEPRSGETADAYRTRVEPLVADAGRLNAGRVQFESFVSRLEGALRAALPEAEVAQKRAEALVVRPAARAEPGRVERRPESLAYDPYLVYYPSPMRTMLDIMLISSFMHMAMPPPIMVVHPSGVPIGDAASVAAHPESVSPDAPDPGEAGGGMDYDGDGIEDPMPDSFDGGGDVGDAGGDFDGGGFDGGDFGGGDFGLD